MSGLTCRKAGVSEAVGSEGLDRPMGLRSELVTTSVGMSSRPLGLRALPLWLPAGESCTMDCPCAGDEEVSY